MLIKRPKDDRGITNNGWLNGRHTFSFGRYFDPEHMGFSALRVINEDHIAAGSGFGTHPHDNMEIMTYVLKGELVHKDSMGNGSIIRPGEVQMMSAGTGVAHSEFNNLDDQELHLLQIWVLPNVQNLQPTYQQKSFNFAQNRNKFITVASPDGRDGSLVIRQDSQILIGTFAEGEHVELSANPIRKYWLQMAQGNARINGIEASSGDGFAILEEKNIQIDMQTPSEILVFDLPGV